MNIIAYESISLISAMASTQNASQWLFMLSHFPEYLRCHHGKGCSMQDLVQWFSWSGKAPEGRNKKTKVEKGYAVMAL